MSEIDCWSFYEIKIQNKISLSFIIKGNRRKRAEAFDKSALQPNTNENQLFKKKSAKFGMIFSPSLLLHNNSASLL